MVPLPAEVLLLVSSFLTQRDQLECMTVCRHWYDVIYHYSLFCDMYVYSEEQLDKLLNKVKSDPLLGKKVERFTLLIDQREDYKAEIIAEHFPNLRHLAIINTDNDVYGTEPITPLESHPWCKHMESIVEYLSDINTKTLLLSGMCKNLAYINVTGRTTKSGLDFIEALINAPSLNTLHLSHYALTFHDLEQLHKNAPLLNKLVLSHVVFSDVSIPHDIEPASLVKRFILVSAYFGNDTFNAHFPYVCQKYTHLEQLTLDFNQTDDNSDDEQKEYSQEELQHQKRVRSYLQILAPHLKALSLNLQGYRHDTHCVDFDFNLLDEFGFQIKKMELGRGIDSTMLIQLAETTQVQYIESLRIKEIFEAEFYGKYIFGRINYFTVLKELTLGYHRRIKDYERPSVDLDDILHGISEIQLETLRIYQVKLDYNATLVDQVCPSLKTLALFNVVLKTGVDVVIAQVFPNLKNLTLNKCFHNKGTLMLPQTDLSYLDISGVVEESPFKVLVITMDNGEQRLYTTNKTAILNEQGSNNDEGDNVFYRFPFSSRSYSGFPDSPLVVVVCKSVYNVSFRNVIA